MMTPNVHVVIVTYGQRLELLKDAIAPLIEDSKVAMLHIVSNNAGYSLPNHPKINPTLLRANTGSANGYKVGIEAALACKPEFLWLLDDDNRPAQQALQTLLNEYEALDVDDSLHSKNGFLALVSKRRGRQVNKLQRRVSSSFLGFRFGDLVSKVVRRFEIQGAFDNEKANAATTPIEVSSAPYGGLFFKPALIDTIGLPNADLVLYADDTEFTSRVPQRGGRLYLVPNSLVEDLDESWNVVKQGGSSLALWLKTPNDVRAYYSARNLAYFEQIQANNSLSFRVNRGIYILLLGACALFFRRFSRFKILAIAFDDAAKGKLGLRDRFPL